MPEGFATGRQRRSAAVIERLLRRAVNTLILRPWFDDTALRLLTRWYFPLSRGWAALLAANGDAAQFAAGLPLGRLTARLAPRLLETANARQLQLAAAEARWEEAFFGSGPASAEIEAARVKAAIALMQLRAGLAPMHLEQPLPAVAFAVETEDDVLRVHGRRLRDRARAFLPERPAAPIEASRGYRSRRGVEGWLRFPAPVGGAADRVWARVRAPAGGGGRMPSIVFAHGIGMEPEYWGEPRDPCVGLLAAGVRVVRPEAPWHGRRRLPGFYGGEPLLARGPNGLLDFLHAHVVELGQLIAWARATRGGPVALGGVSLGALTAQLAAFAAHDWPPEMRPDAVFLVAPSLALTDVAIEGSLSRALGVPAAMAAAGWSSAALGRWLPLLAPQGEPAVPAANIVVVLGEADEVTLAEGGEALVQAWRVPDDNVFRCRAGHFSTSLGISRDSAPLRCLLGVLDRVGVDGRRAARR